MWVRLVWRIVSRPRLRTSALVLLVIVVSGGASAGGYLETRAIRTHHNPVPNPSPSVPAALASALSPPPAAPRSPASPAALPVPAAVADALRAAASSPALGGRLLARVVDVQTGAVLFDDGGTTAAAPASTAKLLTAAAVLSVYPVNYRFRTSVVAGPAGTIVLVGGGDPTLTAAAAGSRGAYDGAARIADLAATVRAARLTVSRIVVDDSLFSGPAVSPYWDPRDVPTSYAAPITAAMVDGGRAAPGDAVRSPTPDLAAGRALAVALGRPGLPVALGRAPAEATPLGTVASAPLAQLIEQMLQQSDNVIAEVLARHVAIATHGSASFDGAAAAIRSTLTGAGVPVGAGMHDGSGLAPADRVSPAVLVALLRAAALDPPLSEVLAALPVASWSGTLAGRYLPGSAAAAGAGVVRAKTGTLATVASLAGVVHDRSGRLLAFAFIADQATGGTGPADAALDLIAARLAGCGCS